MNWFEFWNCTEKCKAGFVYIVIFTWYLFHNQHEVWGQETPLPWYSCSYHAICCTWSLFFTGKIEFHLIFCLILFDMYIYLVLTLFHMCCFAICMSVNLSFQLLCVQFEVLMRSIEGDTRHYYYFLCLTARMNSKIKLSCLFSLFNLSTILLEFYSSFCFVCFLVSIIFLSTLLFLVQ